MQPYFIQYFQQHLKQLREEIAAYQNEQDLWVVVPGINNSAGNLCYHLIGNLNYYIGAALGQTGYQRNRDLEFSIKNVPQAELLQGIDEVAEMIARVLPTVENLEAAYPETFFAPKNTIAFYLFRLLTHLNYHLGQVNYHRRLLAVKS